MPAAPAGGARASARACYPGRVSTEDSARTGSRGGARARRGVATLAGLALAGLAVAPVAAGPRRRGKVVRVERVGKGRALLPRFCQVTSGAEAGQCFGLPPRVGEVGVVVNRERVLGEVRVEAVESANGACPDNPTLWQYQASARAGGVAQGSGDAWAVFDGEVGPSSRMLEGDDQGLPGQNGQRPFIALDRDGDGRAELALVVEECADQAGPSGTGQAFCLTYFARARGGDSWTSLRRDVLRICF